LALQRRSADLGKTISRKRPDCSVWAERSLHRTIKDFDGVDGEEFCTGANISTLRVVDPAVSGKSGC
jgi:hypothetical protein